MSIIEASKPANQDGLVGSVRRALKVLADMALATKSPACTWPSTVSWPHPPGVRDALTRAHRGRRSDVLYDDPGRRHTISRTSDLDDELREVRATGIGAVIAAVAASSPLTYFTRHRARISDAVVAAAGSI